MPDKLLASHERHSTMFRHPTIGMPDKLKVRLDPDSTPFRHPTIGMPDKLLRTSMAAILFRHPTIGMPDTLVAGSPSLPARSDTPPSECLIN